jgi:N-acetylglutamate synthase-like GNAT family acetyltransferase
MVGILQYEEILKKLNLEDIDILFTIDTDYQINSSFGFGDAPKLAKLISKHNNQEILVHNILEKIYNGKKEMFTSDTSGVILYFVEPEKKNWEGEMQDFLIVHDDIKSAKIAHEFKKYMIRIIQARIPNLK